MEQTFKQDKGTAGLTILLSVIVMLFVIGLIVMIFVLMSGELQSSKSVYTTSSQIANNDSFAKVSEVASSSSVSTFRDVVCTWGKCYNGSYAGAKLIVSANYTTSDCTIVITTAGSADLYNGTAWKCTVSYTYGANTTATDVISATSNAIGGSADWFDIFIVITAMVVLILLTVIIITAIRSSGMVAGAGSQQGANSVGTA